MTLENLKNWLKTRIAVGDGIQLGGIDGNKERFIGVYPAKQAAPRRICLGGATGTRTDELHAALLVHWTKSQAEAEAKARALAGLFYGLGRTDMDGATVYAADATAPIWAGKDSRGVCEYVINLKIICEKE